ncbi:right-handed parallel beta-helix repeat-containing protein [Arenicella xantha]|uniref:Parallel beta helix pectate lyase-like protein n=1 Tax=Arenicella xantha TaxID=644221 RepID=A0A395JR70_9GAMM|nr:right-handed parallel beta-helix repeat-containing protein [Arenicella xantha]RBP51200.1 parallel beta helix pectate lyase-like protein [Arenicella xantha]
MTTIITAFTAGLEAIAATNQDNDFILFAIPPLVANTAASSSKPGADNTGFKMNANVQTINQSVVISEPNAELKDRDINGCVSVAADNVRIRNVRINCAGFYGIKANSGHSNLLIEDVEIFGMQSAGILGSDFTLRRANIHDSGADAIKPGSNVIIEASWLHRLGSKAGSHSDGVQMVSGNNVTIRGNNIDMPHDLSGFTNSQCMIIQTNNGPIDSILIEDNWLNGGGYCVQINDKGTGFGPPTNVQIIGNKFGKDCQFGILRFGGSSPVLRDNIYEFNKAPIGSDFTLCGDEHN